MKYNKSWLKNNLSFFLRKILVEKTKYYIMPKYRVARDFDFENAYSKFVQLSKTPNRYVNAIKHRIELYHRQGLLGFKDELFGSLFYKYPQIFNDKNFVSLKLIRVTKEYVEREKWVSDGR